MRLRWFGYFGLILGLVFGLFLVLGYRFGFTTQWTQRLIPSSPITALQEGAEGLLIVQMADATTYVCPSFTEETCVLTTEDIPPQNIYHFPCDFSEPPFLFLAHPPQNMLLCFHPAWSPPRNFDTLYYAVDQSGALWQWHHSVSLYVFFLHGVFLFLSMFLGASGVGFIGVVWQKSRYQKIIM